MTEIFNRNAVRLHAARAQKGDVDFLWHHIAVAIQDRLLDIRRDFAVGVEISPVQCVFTSAFLQKKKIANRFFFSSLGGHGQALIDEEFLPLKQGSLDVLVSVGSMHWINDLPGALIQMKRALKPDGVLIAALLGGETLTELRQALTQSESELYGGISPRVSPFATLPDMAALMQRAGFSLPVVDHEKLTITYKDIVSLMKDLRGMGQSNAVMRKNPKNLSREFWVKADHTYRENFATEEGRLKATVEILYLIGWSPDASQPQPLKRGSATHRLADILKTEEKGTGEFV